MSFFDQLVTKALQNQSDLANLRVVVEKELLHHDIIKIMSQNNLLTDLVFIGGTCLRVCYGGVRLSEDLDFTGGKGFLREDLSQMKTLLVKNLNEKYGLNVSVSEPQKEVGNVDTWKIKVETRPEHKHMPAQRINIDICAVPSYEVKPMVIINHYGVEMGTSGLTIQAQSREETYADKLLAFALRPNRLKYRDLWDMVWLHQQGIKPRFELVPKKLQDRDLAVKDFSDSFDVRYNQLTDDKKMALAFNKEMHRFLPHNQFNKIAAQDALWEFIVYLMGDLQRQLRDSMTK